VHVAINAVAVSAGGGETYLLNLLQALSRLPETHEYTLLLTGRHRCLVPRLPPCVRPAIFPRVPRAAGPRMAWEQTAIPLHLRRMPVDVLFAAYNTAPLLAPAPVVLLAHNADPYAGLDLPVSRYARMRNVILRGLGRASARVARRVVFVSHSSARVMASRMGVEASRVRVVHHGWCDAAAGSRPPDPGWRAGAGGYILSVADLYPHKNLERLLVAFDGLARERGYAGDLLVAGAERSVAPAYAARLRRLRDRLSVRGRIRFLGALTQGTLFEAYRHADLFVLPSLYETFGLPLLEAMGCGVPVATADWRRAVGGEAGRFNAGPEVCGEAAEYFDPTDVEDMRGAMGRVLSDAGRRAELVRLGRLRAGGFSWDRAALQMTAIFHEAAASGGARTGPGGRPTEAP
jgi:glycosyltransferase involved in cell wall biosynthesis